MNKYVTLLQDELFRFNQKGFFHLLFANALIQFFGFGSQFVVAWLLLPEQLGQIRIMQTYLSLAMLFTTYGFNTSTLKLCSEDRSKGEIVFLYRKALQYVFISLIITWPIILIACHYDLISKDIQINRLFPYFSLALIPMTFSSISSLYLQATKEIKMLATVQSITKIISVFLIIVLTFYYSLNGYVAAVVIGYFFTFVYLAIKTNKKNRNINFKSVNNPFSIHIKYANISFITNLIGQVGLQTDILLMNYLINDRKAIGYYSFGLTLIILTSIFTTAVNQITVPYLSEKSSNPYELKLAYAKYNRINNISSLVFAILLIVVIPFFITFLFNDKYVDSIPYFRVLVIAWFFQSIVTFKGYVLWGIGKIVYNMYSSVILLFMGIIISYFLMSYFDVIGIAYGKLVTNIFALFIVSFFYKKGLKNYENDFARI